MCVNDVEANKVGIDALVDELNRTHGPETAIGVVADVSKADQVQSLIDQTVERLGPLTVMIANAGIVEIKAALDISEESMRRLMDVNFFGVWHCYRLAAKQMIAQGAVGGSNLGYRIIGASSIAGFKPFQMMSSYIASKFAVRGLTQSFAKELAAHSITVNSYAPGVIDTAMWAKIDETIGGMTGAAKGETMAQFVQESTAMQRAGTVEDVSKVVGGFLCSKNSDFVTGQTIVCDGGIVFT